MTARDWVSFWNAEHSIYVNARHREAHYARIAGDILRYVPPEGVVLDYGCGEALSAGRIAEKAGSLTLCEAAPNVRTSLARRFSSERKIAVISPAELATRKAESFDVIVMHSVAQYLSGEEFDRKLAQFRKLVRPGGLVVIGDIIPPATSAVTEALSLLRFAAAHGFLLAAMGGLVRTTFSDYRTLRATLGLSRYEQAETMARLQRAGFLAKRAGQNIGHNPSRMTFLAWPLG